MATIERATEFYGKSLANATNVDETIKAVKWLDKAVQFAETGDTAKENMAFNAALKSEAIAFG
jgi:hypothetical protein